MEGGVVAYSVMQVYGSLALEDNSKIGEAERHIAFPASAPMPSSSQAKKQIHSLQWVLLGED